MPASVGPWHVVVKNADDTIGHRIQHCHYPHFSSALGYLERHFETRPRLDVVDNLGRFVEWEIAPPIREDRSATVVTDDEHELIRIALLALADVVEQKRPAVHRLLEKLS